jgi:group I intron endonuclease
MDDNDIPPEDLGCIYLITNKINGRMYVGKTIRNTPAYRFYQHCKRSQNSPTTPLYIDMKKFGVQNFSVDVLCYDYKENLDDDEIFWAETLQTYVWDKPTHGSRGYNATKCGVYTPGAIPSAETRYKIGCTWRGKTFSDEHKKNLCIARKKRIQTPEYNMKARNNRIASVLENGAKGVKLKKEDVLTIVKKVNEGVSQTELASTYNIAISVISRIMSGDRWGHFTGIPMKEVAKRTHAKLGMETANKIREMYASGDFTITELLQTFNVHRTTIINIIKGKLYPHK